jgi:hypothetical protein
MQSGETRELEDGGKFEEGRKEGRGEQRILVNKTI